MTIKCVSSVVFQATPQKNLKNKEANKNVKNKIYKKSQKGEELRQYCIFIYIYIFVFIYFS